MRKLLAVALVAALALGIAACARVGDPPAASQVVARVSGQDITMTMLTERARLFELFFRQPMEDDAIKAELLGQLVEQRLLAADAGRMGLAVDQAKVEEEMGRFLAALEERYESKDELEAKMKELKLTREMLQAFIAEFLLAQMAAEKVQESVTLSDEEIGAFYEENKLGLYTFTEDVARARHILLPAGDESLARDLVARARAGEAFADLAREHSVDPGSARNGGDLGYFTRGDMVPEFSAAVFSLEPGQISDPVKSQFGWHIIKVEDRRPAGVIPLDQARSDIEHKLLPGKRQEALAAHVDQLKQQAGVEVLFKPAEAEAPPATSGEPPEAGGETPAGDPEPSTGGGATGEN